MRNNRGFSILELLLAFALISMAIVAVTRLSVRLPNLLNSKQGSKTLVEYLPNPIADDGNNTCFPLLSGNWKQPVIRSKTFSNAPFTKLVANKNLLFAAAVRTQSRTDPTLFVFDASSSTQPILISTYDTASTTRSGIASIAISFGYLYAANAVPSNFSSCKVGPTCAQLQVFAIQSPSSLQNLVNYQLATTTQPYAIGSNGQASGFSIAINGNYLYLGLTKTGSTQGDEFNILDVQDPKNPLWLGGYHVGRTVTDIVVKDFVAYLATDDPNNELLVLDVHDPRNIEKLAIYNAPGIHTFGYGKSLAILSSNVLLGRTYEPNAPELIAVANASSDPLMLSGIRFNGQNATSTEDILVRNYLAFVLTDSSLQFISYLNPGSPSAYAASYIFPKGNGTSLACEQNTLYVSTENSDMSGNLNIITSN